MKLSQISKIYFPENSGGIGQVIQTVADCMRGEDQEIIVCNGKPGVAYKEDKYDGVDVVRCKQMFTVASTPMSFQYLKQVKNRTKDSDIVLSHFPYPLADVAILLGCYSGKLAVWWHCDFVSYKRLAPFYRPLVRHTLKKADMILVSSEGNIDGAETLRPFRDKCRIIPFSVSDEHLEAGRKHFEERRNAKKDKDDDEVIHIIFVGRLVWYKGCDVLLRAFAKLINDSDDRDYDLTFVGGGPKKEELEELAVELNVADKVRFLGMVSEEEKRAEIAKSDFMVLPSISEAEAFAIVQIEAMAYGKPVINTSLNSGVPYVSIDGQTGITVKPEDDEALYNAMKKLGEDDELRKKYSEAAYERVQEEYTRTKMMGRVRNAFEELLER